MLDSKRKRARAQLDTRLPMNLLHQLVTPPKGYIKAIREALGMTAAQLGLRLGLSQPTVAGLEQSEQLATIQLKTLRKVAEALGCQLVYAFVPKEISFDEMVQQRARTIAIKALEQVGHTMALEDQSSNNLRQELEINLYIDQNIKDRDLWRKAN